MKKLLLLLILLLPCLALAEDNTSPWRYALTDEGTVITEYIIADDNPDTLVIPSELDGHPVIDIAEGAFTVFQGELFFERDLPYLTNKDGFLINTRTDTLLFTAPSSRGKELPAVRRLGNWSLINWAEWDMDVVIPEGVEEIGAAAFYDVEVTSLTLPESLRLIETDAFYSFGVEGGEIILPAGVEMVQFGSFGISYVDADATGRVYWHLTVTPTDKWRTRFETYFEYAARTGDDSDMEDYTRELYEYEETADGLVITNARWHAYGNAMPETITLPAEIWGEPVVGIADNALNTSESLSRDQHFTLVIPEGIKWVEADAFQCCHHADVIVFPASLTEIPESCFSHVHAEFIVAEGNPRYVVQDGFLIDKQTDTLLFTTPECQDKPIPAVRRLGAGSMDNYAVEWGEALVIPEGVEEIGSYAFYDWEYSHVTLPESLRLIESMAFEVGITEPVVIPAGVEMVQCCAFSGCGSVIEVIASSESTHFETQAEHDARFGETFWMHDWE